MIAALASGYLVPSPRELVRAPRKQVGAKSDKRLKWKSRWVRGPGSGGLSQWLVSVGGEDLPAATL